jgi:hypothetical protein
LIALDDDEEYIKIRAARESMKDDLTDAMKEALIKESDDAKPTIDA